MQKPFFSIGIPIYNTEKYLRDCIDSVLSQDFTDFELILVDDGSTDNSLTICKEYAEKDDRIKVFHKENSGISHTRNCLIDYSAGEYVFQLDSDDKMCEELLTKAYNELVKNNYPDVLVGEALRKLSNGKIEQFAFPTTKPEWYNYTKDYLIACMIATETLPSPMWRKFVKLSLIKDSNIRFESKYIIGEDRDFTAKLFRYAKDIYKSDINTVYWTSLREGSATTQPSISAVIADVYCLNDYMLEVETWDIPDEKMEEIRIYFVNTIRDITTETVWRNKKEVDAFVSELDKIINRQFKQSLKKLSTDDKTYAVIFKLYNVIGIKNTMTLYNFYLRMRGAIE